MGRDTHERVKQVCAGLKSHGWTTWFDEEDMADTSGNIDSSMASGIEDCDAVIVFLTQAYIERVNHASRNPRSRSNCKKEWDYSHALGKIVLPVSFEPSVRPWTGENGLISMHFASSLAVDGSGDDTAETVSAIDRSLSRLQLRPNSKGKGERKWPSAYRLGQLSVEQAAQRSIARETRKRSLSSPLRDGQRRRSTGGATTIFQI